MTRALPRAILSTAIVFGASACSSVKTEVNDDTSYRHPDAVGTIAPSSESPQRTSPQVAPTGPVTTPPVPSLAKGKAKYVVSPGTDFPTLQSVAPLLEPGDIVDVLGDTTYTGGVRFDRSGSPEKPIVVRGVRINGKRPVVSGGRDTIEAAGSHYVFEGLEISGASFRCFFNHAAEVTLRDSLVRDCPQHGILGADDNSGTFTMEYVEVRGSGTGDRRHQVYMATDERNNKGSVFRMRFSWIHDGVGGNNVKSRAERNEIHYNWFENARYHELEMVGADGQDAKLAREDSEVVGNVFVKTNDHYVVRIGGDGTANTDGRYRFVNNTFVVNGPMPIFRVMNGVESWESYNNAFFKAGGGTVVVAVEQSVQWASGKRLVGGSHNWVPEGSDTPVGWQNTVAGTDPRFVSLATYDLRPDKGSPLIGRGTDKPTTMPEAPFPRPLLTRESLPPNRTVEPAKRRSDAKANIGAMDP